MVEEKKEAASLLKNNLISERTNYRGMTKFSIIISPHQEHSSDTVN
jgi:hypothetical protein